MHDLQIPSEFRAYLVHKLYNALHIQLRLRCFYLHDHQIDPLGAVTKVFTSLITISLIKFLLLYLSDTK